MTQPHHFKAFTRNPIKGFAYATREEAVVEANRCVAANIEAIAIPVFPTVLARKITLIRFCD